MANMTTNSLFVASAVVFVVGLLLLAYPYLTLATLVLCAIGHTYHSQGALNTIGALSSAVQRQYAQLSSVLWPTECVNDRPGAAYAPNLLGGTDLPSPIPHVSGGLDTVKNRRSLVDVDEIVSSTPRSSPAGVGHGGAAPIPIPLQLHLRSSSPELVASDSRQLNFGRINTPKTSRMPTLDIHQNHVEMSSSQRLRNRAAGGGKTVQPRAGPVLHSAHYGPPFDAGIFVNVNSPGFTDRLVRCAGDNTGLNWGQATQPDRYNSVGLFPVVHLGGYSPPSLTSRNSQKAPNSNVRVRIAPPVYPDQHRQHCLRGNNIQMRSYIPTREALRRNEMAKSVLESLQEASRKRIYSQCQEVLEDDSAKKRQRKSDAAIPNPNCDMYQYRHIRAPPVPSIASTSAQNDIHHQGKRVHDDPSSKRSDAKRQRQQLSKLHSSNNEISSSLSSSKTLLQQLSGSKRKADYEYSDDACGKHFKESVSAVDVPSSSRWLHTGTCEKGESAARTQEVVRSQKKNTLEESCGTVKKIVQKKVMSENVTQGSDARKACSVEKRSVMAQKGSEKEPKNNVNNDLTSKLFRKDIVSKSQTKASIPEKRGSSWTQVPPEADERCLLEQGSSSELDRPERFQSLLSRMCGQEIHNVKHHENAVIQESSDPPKSSNASATSIVTASFSHSSVIPAVSTTNASVSSLSPVAVSSTAAVNNPGSYSLHQIPSPAMTVASLAPVPPSSTVSAFSTSTAPPQQISNFLTFSTSTFNNTSVPDDKTDSGGHQSQPDGNTPSHSLSLSSAPALSMKQVFNFNAPDSQNALQSSNPQTLAASTVSSLPANSNAVSIAQPMFNSTVLPIKTSSEPGSEKPVHMSMPSHPLLATSTHSSEFPCLVAQSKPAIVSLSDSAVKSPTGSIASGAVQKPQLTFAVGNSMPFLQTPNVISSSANVITSPPSSSIFNASGIQLETPKMSSKSAEPKNTFGGFKFSGTSSSVFGQPTTSIEPASSSPFSFTPSQSITNSTPDRMVGIASTANSDTKSASGSGSITFGTVSNSSAQSKKPPAFNLSASSVGNSTSDAYNAPFQLTSFGTATTTSSGFSSSSQRIFNGYGSTTNANTAAVPIFGASVQPSLAQNQGVEGFTFGNSTNQPLPSVNFGAVSSTSSTALGDRMSQQSSFVATTTTGFSLPPAVPTFSSSPFGASTVSPFGASSLTSGAAFGGRTGASSPPTFALASSNPPPFGCSSNTSTVPSFGAAATGASAFGVAQPPAEPSFGANSAIASSIPVNSAFTFGPSADKPSVSAFNFGANSVPAPQPFGFGSSDHQQQSSGGGLFQFGQTTTSSSTANFQFGPSSAHPGSGSFSIGSGPTTPQRSRSLQNRRRRI